ncbi:MAG: helix-turn-helix transcriptional regulator [Planctomycetota bacterium]
MSPERQGVGACAVDEARLVLRTARFGFPNGFELEPHSHPWGQLVYASTGVMTVCTTEGTWVVPSRRAVWVPESKQHSIETRGRVRLRAVYLRADLAAALPRRCAVLGVSPLLRELVNEAVARHLLRDDRPEELRLAQVLADQIQTTPSAPLGLPWPTDPRAARVAQAIARDLGSTPPTAELARGSGASPRTLERLFARETGLTLGRWRSQARLLEALRLLAAGESVTEVATAVGFAGPSAFVSMFRRALGTTPGRYFAGDPRAPNGRLSPRPAPEWTPPAGSRRPRR